MTQLRDPSGTGKANYYGCDVQNRITYREANNVTNWNWTLTSQQWYGFTGASDTPDFLTDSSGNVTEKYLTLPGDVLVTIRPNRPSAGGITYSLPNIHGDVFATTNADGSLTSTHITGPYGEDVPGTLNPINTAHITLSPYNL